MSIGAATIGPQGLGQSTLELLSDEKKLNKTLASLKKAQEDAQAAIDLAGPATEIVAIRAQVGDELRKQQELTEQAQQVLDQKTAEAEAKGDEIVAAAVERGNGIVAEAERNKEAALKEVAEANNGLRAQERELTATRESIREADNALTERENALNVRESELDSRSAELDQLNSSLLKEKTKLAEARERINAALG